MKKRYDKLVRDRIPKIIKEDGHECKYHEATDKELEAKLCDKLREETHEFFQNPCAEEMADILEILDEIRRYYNIQLSDVKYQKESKLVNRGGFTKKYILEWTKEKPLIERDGSHVTLNMGNTELLHKDFKTSGTK